jgi:hypothetical protein
LGRVALAPYAITLSRASKMDNAGDGTLIAILAGRPAPMTRRKLAHQLHSMLKCEERPITENTASPPFIWVTIGTCHANG